MTDFLTLSDETVLKATGIAIDLYRAREWELTGGEYAENEYRQSLASWLKLAAERFEDSSPARE